MITAAATTSITNGRIVVVSPVFTALLFLAVSFPEELSVCADNEEVLSEFNTYQVLYQNALNKFQNNYYALNKASEALEEIPWQWINNFNLGEATK